MKIENIERAAALSKLLIEINNRIEKTESLVKAKVGFNLNEHSDSSGQSVDILFTEEGNYDLKTYTAIAEFALEQFKTRKQELITIIEGL